MFNICFSHNLAEVDHFKFVSSRCYAPRAMFSSWLVNKRIPPREDSQSKLPFSFFLFIFFYFIFIIFCSIWAPKVGLDIDMGWGFKVGI